MKMKIPSLLIAVYMTVGCGLQSVEFDNNFLPKEKEGIQVESVEETENINEVEKMMDVQETTQQSMSTTERETVVTTEKVDNNKSVLNENIAQMKEKFLNSADEIDRYDKMYLQKAMTQSDMNVESGNVYEMWDKLLNEIYQYIKSVMPYEKFSRLQKDERNWIKEKDSKIVQAAKEWEGGSGSPMAQNYAGLEATKERCYYLISLLDNMN